MKTGEAFNYKVCLKVAKVCIQNVFGLEITLAVDRLCPFSNIYYLFHEDIRTFNYNTNNKESFKIKQLNFCL